MKDLPSRFKQNFIELLRLFGMYMLALPSRPLRSSWVDRSRVVVGPECEGRLYW